jgi:hypothetical protein
MASHHSGRGKRSRCHVPQHHLTTVYTPSGAEMGEDLTSDGATNRELRQTNRHGMALAIPENREHGNMRVPSPSLIDCLCARET